MNLCSYAKSYVLQKTESSGFACRWVVVPWEFVHFNLFQGGSATYGSHPWHWNFTQGFPTIALTFLPLMVWGICIKQTRYDHAGC